MFQLKLTYIVWYCLRDSSPSRQRKRYVHLFMSKSRTSCRESQPISSHPPLWEVEDIKKCKRAERPQPKNHKRLSQLSYDVRARAAHHMSRARSIDMNAPTLDQGFRDLGVRSFDLTLSQHVGVNVFAFFSDPFRSRTLACWRKDHVRFDRAARVFGDAYRLARNSACCVQVAGPQLGLCSRLLTS